MVGLGTYAMWNHHLYYDVTVYRSQHIGAPQPLPAGSPGAANFADNISGAAPYWRLAYETTKGKNYFEIGTFGMYMKSFPGALTGLTGVFKGPTDSYRDTAADLTYERMFKTNVLSVHGTYIYEKSNLSGTFLAGGTISPPHHLQTGRMDATYHRGNKYTTTLGAFSTTGTRDSVLYAPPSTGVAGSANGKPTTGGYIAQATYWPIQNLEIGLQYKGYLKYNGATHNYDGFGRSASGNNTAYLFVLVNF